MWEKTSEAVNKGHALVHKSGRERGGEKDSGRDHDDKGDDDGDNLLGSNGKIKNWRNGWCQ